MEECGRGRESDYKEIYALLIFQERFGVNTMFFSVGGFLVLLRNFGGGLPLCDEMSRKGEGVKNKQNFMLYYL